MVEFKVGDLIKSKDFIPIERKFGMIIKNEGIDCYRIFWIKYEIPFGVGKTMIFGKEYLCSNYQVIEDDKV